MQLHVRVVEATDIARMDLHKSDPYCLVSLSSTNDTRRTRTKENTLNPRWNEDFHFNVVNPAMSALKILMRDKDVSYDDDMATLEVQLCSLTPGQIVDQWYNMIPCKRIKKGGRIHLILHLAPVGVPPFQGMMGAPVYGVPPPMAAPVYAAPPPMAPVYGVPPPPMGAPVYAAPRPMGAPVYPQPGYPQPGYPQPGYPQPGYPGYPPRPY